MEDHHTTSGDHTDAPQADPQPLQISDSIRSAWSELSGWFIFMGITIGLICLIMMYLMVGLLSAAVEYKRIGTILLFDFFAVGIASAIFYLVISSQLRRGLEREENELVEKGFGNFNRLYRLSNVVSIIGIASFLLLFILLFVNLTPMIRSLTGMGRAF
jgi:MFS superfamily sulfate permease-like transporter